MTDRLTRRTRAVAAALLVALLWAGALAPAAQAQFDDETARYNAVQWLKRKLNKPNLILVEFTYSGASWPDTSMGCPVPEGTPVEQRTVNGYEWHFLFDNMVRYEVHSTLDGNDGVLCSAISATSDTVLSTYIAPTFTLLVPEAWLSFPADDGSEILFAPQQDVTCDQPGMRARALGRVASGVTPDQLIDETLAGQGATDAITARETVGSFGKTTAYTVPCDGGTQQRRTSAFVQYGSAYLVEQWAPQADFEAWDQTFRDVLAAFKPGEGTLNPAALAAAPAAEGAEGEAPVEELAALPLAHVFVGDVFLGALNSIPGRSITSVPTVERRHLEFSPDGLLLSFVDVDHRQLRIVDANAGLSARRLADNVDATFPPAWRADSQEIAYAVATGATNADGAALFDLFAIPASGGDPRPLGQLAYRADCPAEVADPSDRLYYATSGPGDVAPALAWLGEGTFLASTACQGGVAIVNVADGSASARFEDVRGGVLSPDRRLFAGRGPNGLVIIDVTSGARANLSIGAGAAQIAWSLDGASLYYATATLADSTTLDNPADEARGTEVFGFWPVRVGVYELALMRVDMATNEETRLWRGEGRGIGRIAPAPDGSGVLFSVIPSSLPLAEVFRAGADPLAQREMWPEPALYWLASGQAGARLLAYSGQPVFAPVTVSPAPAPEAETQPTEGIP